MKAQTVSDKIAGVVSNSPEDLNTVEEIAALIKHEDEKLNGLIGKRVRITFWDGDVDEGILERSEYSKRYALRRELKGDIHFYKSHVKKVEVL